MKILLSRLLPIILGLLLLVGSLTFSSKAFAAVPKLVHYQGRLYDNTGTLLGGAGTNFFFKFSIWDNATVGTGTRLWPSAVPTAQTLSVQYGVFNYDLGTDATDGDLSLIDFQTKGDTLYLQVEVSSTIGGTYETLAPRQRVVAQGNAINADKLQNATPGTGNSNILKLNSTGGVDLTGTTAALSAAGTATLTLQGSSTGNINFFGATYNLTNTGALTIGSVTGTGALTVASGGSNTNLTLNANGSGTITLGAASTGNIQFFSSNNSVSSSGNLTLVGGVTGASATLTNSSNQITLGTGAGTTGILTWAISGGNKTITFPNETGTVCTTGSVCTGYQASGSFANTALSNLALVAINTSLLPSGNNTIDLGDGTHQFRTAYIGTSFVLGTSGANSITLSFTSPTAARTITFPDAGGTVAVSGTSPVTVSATGAISVGDATTAAKGIASFNATNFTVTAGAVNTIQNINSTATPTFASLTLNNTGTVPTLDLQHGAVSSNNEINQLLAETFTQTITAAVTNDRFNQFLAPTISSATAQAVTNAATVYIDQPPIAAGAGPATITNSASLLFGNAANQLVLIQQSAADTVGRNLSITAGQGNAVAANSGKAGGSINLTAGAASATGTGTAAGGDVVITGGAGAGGGATGKVGFFNVANNFITSAGALQTAGSHTGTAGIFTNNANPLVLGTTNTASITLGALTAAQTYTIPTSGGTFATSGTSPVSISAAGAISVADATTAAKGIASFNSTNFTVSAGAVNTVQDIATTSSPTFAAAILTGGTSLTLGTASTNTGAIVFKNSTNANTLTIQSGATSTSYTLTLPTAQGGVSTFLQNNGSGVLSWASSGGGCSTCLQQVPAVDSDNTVVPTADVTSLTIRQTSAASPTKNIFAVTNSGNTTNYAVLASDATWTLNAASSKAFSLQQGGSNFVDITTAGATTVQSRGTNQNLTLASSGTGIISATGTLNLTGGDLQTAGTQRLTNAGALNNITGYTQTSGTISITSTTVSGDIISITDNSLNTSGANLEKLTLKNNNTAAAGLTVNGLAIAATGSTPASGTNTVNLIDLTATALASNVFNAININAGFDNYIKSANFTVTSGGVQTAVSATLSGATPTLTLGSSSNVAGIIFKNGTDTNTITLNSGTTTTSYTLTLPVAQGAASTFLQNNGSGVLSWASSAGCSTCLFETPATTAQNTVQSSTAGVVGITIKGKNGDTAKLFDVFDSQASPAEQAFFDSGGALTVNKAITAPTSSNTINSLIINAGAISGGTGITSSGSITFSGLSTAGVVTNTSAGLLGTLAGTTTTVLHGNASGLPTFGSVVGGDLASNIAITTTGVLTQNFTSSTDLAKAYALNVTNSSGSGTVTVNGILYTPTGTSTTGTNTINGINFASPVTPNSNNFYGLNFSTGYTDLLRYNGTQLISGTGIVQSAAISGSYTGITGVGTLTAGTLGAGFTTVAVARGGTGVTTFGGTNTVLYTSSADTLSSITTANNGVLITSGGGVPSISSTLPTAVQNNITSLGTLSSLTVTGTITSNNGSLDSENVTENLSATGTVNGITVTPTLGGTAAANTYTLNALNVANVTGTCPSGATCTNNGINLGTGLTNYIKSANFTVDSSGNLTAGTYNTNTFTSTALTFGGTNDTITSTGTLTITPAGALTIGATGQQFTLQGTSASTITGTNAGNTTTVGFVTPTAARAINFPNEGGTLCIQSSANCGFTLGSGTAVLLAPSSAQADSSTNNAIFINKTGVGSLLNLTQASAVTATYSTTDLNITRNLTTSTASINNAGVILGLTNPSGFTGASDLNNPDIIKITNATPTSGAIFTGNFLLLQRADAAAGAQVTKFQVDATGALTLTGAISAPTSSNTINSLIINAGAISGGTGITSSGSITFSGLSTAGVVTNTSAGLLGTLAGTTTTVLHGNASGLPTYASIVNADLASGSFTNITGVGTLGSLTISGSTNPVLSVTSTATGATDSVTLTNTSLAGAGANLANLTFKNNNTAAGLTVNGATLTAQAPANPSSGTNTTNFLNLSSPTVSITSLTQTLNAVNLSSPGTLTTNPGTINWNALNITTPNITQTSGTINSTGLKLVLGTITTGGNQTGLDISAGGTAGTTNGISFTGTLTNFTNLINSTNFTVTSAGTVTIAAGQSYTGSGAVTLSSGSNGNITLAPNGSGNLIFNPDSNTNFQITATAAPTATMVSINTAGQLVTSDGIYGLSVVFDGGALTGNINAAARFQINPGTSSGSEWDGVIATGQGTSAGVTESVIRLEGYTASNSGTVNGIKFIAGFTNGIVFPSSAMTNGIVFNTDPTSKYISSNNFNVTGAGALTIASNFTQSSGTTSITSNATSGNSLSLTNTTLNSDSSTLASFSFTENLSATGTVNGLTITPTLSGTNAANTYTTNVLNTANVAGACPASATCITNGLNLGTGLTNYIKSANWTVTSAGAETLGGNLTFSGANPNISASTANTNLTINANGTGTITLASTSTGNVGFFNVANNFITSGGALTIAGNLTLSGASPTISSTNASTLTISSASNQNIAISPGGTGSITSTLANTSGNAIAWTNNSLNTASAALEALTFKNNNTAAAGLAVNGLTISATGSTPASATNTENLVNLSATALASNTFVGLNFGSGLTTGLNFASAPTNYFAIVNGASTTNINVIAPTANRTINFPDNGGTVGVAGSNAISLPSTGAIALLTTSANDSNATTSNNSGLIITTSGVGLLRGCADTQILKWILSTGVWACAADNSGGSPTLNSIAAANATATINNGDNAIVWNWSLTTSSKVGFTFGENIASTGSSTTILGAQTLSGSTAVPLTVNAAGIGTNNLPAESLNFTANLSAAGTVRGLLIAETLGGTAAANTYTLNNIDIAAPAGSCPASATCISNGVFFSSSLTNYFRDTANTTRLSSAGDLTIAGVINASGTGQNTFNGGTILDQNTALNSGVAFTQNLANGNTSGLTTGFQQLWTDSTGGTGGFSGIQVLDTIGTGTGSGNKRLLDLQVGSTSSTFGAAGDVIYASINRASGSTNLLRFQTGSSLADVFKITDAGALTMGGVLTANGTGTSNFSGEVDVTRNQNASTFIKVINTDTTNTNSRARFQATSGAVLGGLQAITGSGVFVGAESNDSLGLITNNTTRVTITSVGNLSIDSGTLTVSGTGNSTFAGPVSISSSNTSGNIFSVSDSAFNTTGANLSNLTFTNANSTSTATTVNGLSITPTGTTNTNTNANTLNAINLPNVTTVANNVFNAINVGTGYDNIIKAGNATLTAAGDLYVKGPEADIRAYGAKCDGKINTNASSTSGSAVLTLADTTQDVFAATDVGKNIGVSAWGTGGTTVQTTISAFTSSTSVTLAVAAGNTASGQVITWGTDDATSIQNAINDAASNGRIVKFPAGMCLIKTGLTVTQQSVQLKGEGTFGNFDVGSVRTMRGTGLVWDGTAGGTMLSFSATVGASNQSLKGVGVKDMYFRGNGMFMSAIGMSLTSVQYGEFEHLYFQDFSTTAIDMTTVAGALGEATDDTKNNFKDITIRQLDAPADAAIAIRMDSNAASSPAGNPSNNNFENIAIIHKNGIAMKFLNSDSNRLYGVTINRASGGTGIGVEFNGSNTTGGNARGNVFWYLAPGAGGVTSRGTSLTFPADRNQIHFYSQENGEPSPVIEPGAVFYWDNDKEEYNQLKVNSFTNDIVKTTSGSNVNDRDFNRTANGTSATFTNINNTNDQLALSDGTVPNAGTGTITTATQPVTSAAVGAGAHSISRPDGKYDLIRGGASTGIDVYDAFAATFAAGPTTSAAVGAGGISIPRGNNQYLIIHGGAVGTTTLLDATVTTGAQAAGPALSGAATATTGTNVFLRPDGRYLILHGGAGTTSVYDPVANTMATGPAASTGTWGAGSLVLPRPDGTAMVINGGATATTNLYNYNTGTGNVGVFTTGPVLPTNCEINGAGSSALRLATGKYVVLSKVNAYTEYDPVANTFSTCTTTAGNGPTVALADGAHAIPYQNGKWLLIIGSGSTVSNVVDVTAASGSRFVAHGTALTTVGAGLHSLMNPDGTWRIINGGGTATMKLDTGLLMTGSYVSEDLNTSAFNGGSTFVFDVAREYYTNTISAATNAAQYGFKFLMRTAQTQALLANATDREISRSGELIRPTSTTDAWGRVTINFYRPIPQRLTDARGTWMGNGNTVLRYDLSTPTLFDYEIDNSAVLRRSGSDFGNNTPYSNTENLAVQQDVGGTFTNNTTEGNSPGGTAFNLLNTGAQGAADGTWFAAAANFTKLNVGLSVAGVGATLVVEFCSGGQAATATCSAWTAVSGLTDGTTNYTVVTGSISWTDPGSSWTQSTDGTPATQGKWLRIRSSTSPTTAPTAFYATISNFLNGTTLTRTLALSDRLILPYGTVTPVSSTSTDQLGTTGLYTGFITGAHPSMPNATTTNPIVIERPDRQFLVINTPATPAANANLYDPVASTWTSQSGAGNIPTAANGAGGFALKLPNGKFLIVLGNATTTTNIYDPNAGSGTRFVVGPALTAAAGVGAMSIANNDGTYTIVHGGAATTTTVYDPVKNTTLTGPTLPVAANCGSWAIPRPKFNQYLFFSGVAAGVAGIATTSLYDSTTKVFTPTAQSLALPGNTGCGSLAFQRQDGRWVIIEGAGGVSGAASTRADLYDPDSNTVAALTALGTAAGQGANFIPRADGTVLILNGNAGTVTTVYIPWGGTPNATGYAPGSTVAGPATATAVGTGSATFQRPDGKWVIIVGGATASAVTNIADVGWYQNGQYLSEQVNVPNLTTNSTLSWTQTSDNFVSFQVRTASSQLALQTASWRNVPRSGGNISITTGDVWAQIEINFARDFPTFQGTIDGVYVSGGGMTFPYRSITLPTVFSYSISNDTDLLNIMSDNFNVFRVSSSGSVYSSQLGSFNAGGADLAERYSSTQPLENGEVVVADPSVPGGVLKSAGAYQPSLLGVVSTQPGFVAGAYTKDSYPIALIGRVPVKVSSENGPIKVGDYLTSASIPGYAMRANQAGRVIGKALEKFDTTKGVTCPPFGFGIQPKTKCGTVLMFVSLTDYLGDSIEVVMNEDQGFQTALSSDPAALGLSVDPSATGTGLSGGSFTLASSGAVTDQQSQILSYLRYLRGQKGDQPARSEVFTDRLSAVLEILSPQVVTDKLIAKKIQADSIEGLEVITDNLSSLSSKVASLSAAKPTVAAVATSSAQPVVPTSFAKITIESAKISLDLSVMGNLLAQGGLTVGGPAHFQNDSIFDKLVTFVGNAVFKGTVSFEVVPVFSQDTAGLAVVKKGADHVDVTFDKEYAQTPILAANLLIEPVTLPDGTIEDREVTQKRILALNASYLVTNRSTKGFTIVLSKSAAEDLTFSWVAIAVKDAKTFQSLPPVVPAVATPAAQPVSSSSAQPAQ